MSVLYLQAANTLAPTESAVLLDIRNNLLDFYSNASFASYIFFVGQELYNSSQIYVVSYL